MQLSRLVQEHLDRTKSKKGNDFSYNDLGFSLLAELFRWHNKGDKEATELLTTAYLARVNERLTRVKDRPIVLGVREYVLKTILKELTAIKSLQKEFSEKLHHTLLKAIDLAIKEARELFTVGKTSSGRSSDSSGLRKKLSIPYHPSNINLVFDSGEYSNEEIAEILALLSDIYKSVGGDQLEIKKLNSLQLISKHQPKLI